MVTRLVVCLAIVFAIIGLRDLLVPLLYFLLIVLTVRLIVRPSNKAFEDQQDQMREGWAKAESQGRLLMLTNAQVLDGLPAHVREGMRRG